MTKWPSKEELDRVLKELENTPGSRVIPKGASPVDRTKYSICAQFVIYMQNHEVSQQELAKKLGIDKALVSKIVHYHFDEFTIDRLIKYLAILDPKLVVEVKARVA
jgi:predicted XRE-type DNA-binding protein